jgi:hypothetical protein
VKEGDKVILGQCRKFGDCKGLLHLSTKPYTIECQLRRSVVSVHDVSICSVAVKILLAMPGTSIARSRKDDQTKLGRKRTLLRHKYLQKMEEGVEPKAEAHPQKLHHHSSPPIGPFSSPLTDTRASPLRRSLAHLFWPDITFLSMH